MEAPCVFRGVQTKPACVVLLSLLLFFKWLRRAAVLQCIRNTAQNLISTHSTILLYNCQDPFFSWGNECNWLTS